jgi:FkbM family methyltransferase
MDFLEKIKLKLRAEKYRTKHDAGGIAYLQDVVKTGDTVIDIGAHKGGYLYFILKQTGDSGKVYAFEPQSSLYNYLLKLKKMFGWKNLTLEHLAVSSTPGTVTLYIPSNKKSSGSSPGASIVESEKTVQTDIKEHVRTVTLDAYCTENNIQPKFLKIDVEGNELQIFKGGVHTLKKYKPRLLVEIEERHIGKGGVIQTWQFLQAMGYNGFFIEGKDKKPLSEFSFERHQNLENMSQYCNNFIFE